MIDVKQAVKAAIEAAMQFYDGQEAKGFQLEEVEKSEDEREWLITLSFFLPDQNPPLSFLEAVTQTQTKKYERKYKIFNVDAESGVVTSMKIREI